MDNKPTEKSFMVERIIAALAALPLSVITFLVVKSTISSEKFTLISGGIDLSLATAAVLCWWFAVKGHVSSNRVIMQFILVGAMVVGGIGFVAGIVGPMIFTPQSNQGPLLGIFVTGPIGFALGGLLGGIIGVVRVCIQR